MYLPQMPGGCQFKKTDDDSIDSRNSFKRPFVSWMRIPRFRKKRDDLVFVLILHDIQTAVSSDPSPAFKSSKQLL